MYESLFTSRLKSVPSPTKNYAVILLSVTDLAAVPPELTRQYRGVDTVFIRTMSLRVPVEGRPPEVASPRHGTEVTACISIGISIYRGVAWILLHPPFGNL